VSHHTVSQCAETQCAETQCAETQCAKKKVSKCITTSEICGFGIRYGIGRKYRPIRVSVSVSDRNQNSGFGRSL
jgi:hypothetical protein